MCDKKAAKFLKVERMGVRLDFAIQTVIGKTHKKRFFLVVESIRGRGWVKPTKQKTLFFSLKEKIDEQI